MSDRKVMQEAIEELQYALSKITAENEELRLYKNLAGEYGLSVFEDIAMLKQDAERYRWLVNYLVRPETNHDDAIVSSNTKAEIDAVIDAARGVK